MPAAGKVMRISGGASARLRLALASWARFVPTMLEPSALRALPARPSNRFLIKPRWHRIELPAVGVVALRRKAVARSG